jgi:hypothetical protein
MCRSLPKRLFAAQIIFRWGPAYAGLPALQYYLLYALLHPSGWRIPAQRGPYKRLPCAYERGDNLSDGGGTA